MKKFLYIALPIFFLIGVLFYDIAQSATTFELQGARIIRELLIIGSFGLLFLYVRDKLKKTSFAGARTPGRLLVQAGLTLVVVVALSATRSFVAASMGDPVTAPSNGLASAAILKFFALVLAFILVNLSFIILLLLKEFIFYKRRKHTVRNFTILVVGIVAATIASMLPSDVLAPWVFDILFGTAIAFAVMNSFKQNWIVFLTRREKWNTLLYSVLIIIIVVILIGLTEEIKAYSKPVYTFVRLGGLFGVTYFSVTFISTLFQLPTAEEYEKKQFEISSLHNVSRLVNQVFDFNELVNAVTGLTLEVCEANASWLELERQKEGESVRRTIVASKNISDDEIDGIVGIGQAPLQTEVYSTRRLLIVQEVASDKRTKHVQRGSKKIGSIACVPLIFHGNMIGCLYATKEIEFGFDQDDVNVLTTFADYVAIAIENSKLIAQSLERERLLQEINLAHQMQQRLLPSRLISMPKLEIAADSQMSTEVGGDYYDFVRLGEHAVGIAVGDVSGKGISAAFYMAEAKGIFQSLSRLGLSPRDFMINANDALRESLDRKSFISLVYAHIDLVKGSISLSRAGHCPVVYVSGDHVQFVRPSGIGLGLVDREKFSSSIEEISFLLKPGDVCLLYTDGLTETRDHHQEEFGFERLAETAQRYRSRSAEDIKTEITKEIRTFTGNSTAGDDQTLVVLKWKG